MKITLTNCQVFLLGFTVHRSAESYGLLNISLGALVGHCKYCYDAGHLERTLQHPKNTKGDNQLLKIRETTSCSKDKGFDSGM